jgi:hypothetical protein
MLIPGWIRTTLVAIGVLVLLLLCLYIMGKEEEAWELFVTEHHCRVTAETEGKTIWSIDGKGRSIQTFIPPTKTYTCDDGVQRTR